MSHNSREPKQGRQAQFISKYRANLIKGCTSTFQTTSPLPHFILSHLMSTSRTQAYIWDIPAQTPRIRTQSHLKHNNKTKHLPPLSLIINFATRTPHPNPFPSSFFLARLYMNRLPISSLPFMARRLNTHLAVPNIQPHFHKAVLSTSPPFHPQPRSSRHHTPTSPTSSSAYPSPPSDF